MLLRQQKAGSAAARAAKAIAEAEVASRAADEALTPFPGPPAKEGHFQTLGAWTGVAVTQPRKPSTSSATALQQKLAAAEAKAKAF